MDPRIPDGKAILNDKVKHREWYRPYGASILESQVGKYFDDSRPSPFMLRAVPAREGTKDIVPAVIHVDGTSRIQTVPDNPAKELELYSKLLKEFHHQTGMPMLLNTSLNVQGKPIASNPKIASKLLHTGGLDAICVGAKLTTKEGNYDGTNYSVRGKDISAK